MDFEQSFSECPDAPEQSISEKPGKSKDGSFSVLMTPPLTAYIYRKTDDHVYTQKLHSFASPSDHSNYNLAKLAIEAHINGLLMKLMK